MVQRPRPDLRGGCAAMRIPTVTAGGAGQPASLPRSDQGLDRLLEQSWVAPVGETAGHPTDQPEAAIQPPQQQPSGHCQLNGGG